VLTADNREASINIGRSIPIITSTQQSTLATANLVNQVQYRDTGVILNILPQVNADGLVNLQVRQEVSDVDNNSFGSSGSPSFILREAETTAVVQDGDSLLIGGIIQETTTRGRSGVPYLMDIPVMGQLFRFENDQVRRVELIILLTPHVVRSRAEALEVTQGYKDRLWDVVDEIERTKGLRPPTQQQLRSVERLRERTTTAEKPGDLLPNRAWED
jgi:general secretion pathway protein D